MLDTSPPHGLVGFQVHPHRQHIRPARGELLYLPHGPADLVDEVDGVAQADVPLDLQVEGGAGGDLQEAVVHHVHQQEDDDQGGVHQQGADVEAHPHRQAHAGGGPQGGRGGEALHLVAPGDDDGARPQKADAADHLGAEAGGVPHPVAGVHKLAHQHGGGRPHAQQHVGPQAGGPLADPPLKADGPAKNHCQQQPEPHRQDVQVAEAASQFQVDHVSSPFHGTPPAGWGAGRVFFPIVPWFPRVVKWFPEKTPAEPHRLCRGLMETWEWEIRFRRPCAPRAC